MMIVSFAEPLVVALSPITMTELDDPMLDPALLPMTIDVTDPPPEQFALSPIAMLPGWVVFVALWPMTTLLVTPDETLALDPMEIEFVAVEVTFALLPIAMESLAAA